MLNVLDTLLEITLFSAVLFGAILLFQRLFRSRISAAMCCAVWALLVLRLMIPVTIDSGFRVFTVPQPQTAVYAGEAPAVNLQPPPVSAPAARIAETAPAGSRTISHASKPDTQTVSVSSKPIDWRAALVLLWLSGAVGLLAHTAIQSMRLRRKIKRGGQGVPVCVQNAVDACKKDLGIHANISVSVQDWLTSPALSASLTPTLLLPKSLDKHALYFGIRHELTHFKRRDHIASLLLMALRCVYWFNPVVWLAFRRIQADMETACDAAVTAHMAGDERTRYIRVMIDMGSGATPLYALGMGAGQGRKALEKRVRGMFMAKRTKPTARIAAGLLAALLLSRALQRRASPRPKSRRLSAKETV